MTNPAFPIVSFTRTMEWHDVHDSPAWAAGSSMISSMGASIMPENRSAWSWQPPHHFERSGPTTLCMYSTDLRYHWLLNDALRWAEDSHSS